MDDLQEAATLKARARRLLRDAGELLAEKTLPKSLVNALQGLRAALRKTWEDLEADAAGEGDAQVDEAQRPTKTEDGKAFPASDYAYVPDPDKPSTWKLRLTSTPGGPPDPRIVGAAVAALGPGFRGQKVEIPEEDLPAVKRKVRAAWRKAHPDASEDDMPEVLREAVDLSFDEIRQVLIAAIKSEAGKDESVWIRALYPNRVVYEGSNGRTYQRSYVVDAESGKATLGEPVEVVGQLVWTPVGEAAHDPMGYIEASELVPLVEGRLGPDGRVPIRIIKPGWGSSGYYPAEVLRRDGPRVFTKGMHMYWDHPTKAEERERPEGSLKNLAAVLASDATYRENGPAGPGLYAEAEVFSPYRKAVEELAPHIGVSIRALGRARPGEADGRQGLLVERIAGAKSIDFVTQPGAGGRVLELFEAAGRGAWSQEGGEAEMENEKLVERLTALEAENTRLVEAMRLREARDLVREQLAKSGLPQLAQARLLERLAGQAPKAQDGSLDRAALGSLVEAAVKEERAYLAGIAGQGARIVGMGDSQSTDGHTMLVEAFKRAGLSEKEAALAAAGR